MDVLTVIFGHDPQSALIIVLNLILIESLLSVDNAAVLATMVIDLPRKQRYRALKYGVIGAYFFRGLCLIFASYLVAIWWLKPIGGLYLLYLCFDYFRAKAAKDTDENVTKLNKDSNWFYRLTKGTIGTFWATIGLVELMDLAFSIDNVFAAVAFTDNIYLIMIGVFIGILTMRFVAQTFVTLMQRFPFLETVAFLVIGILGAKLTLSLVTHFTAGSQMASVLDSEATDLAISIGTVILFLVPLLTSWLFNFPKRQLKTAEIDLSQDVI